MAFFDATAYSHFLYLTRVFVAIGSQAYLLIF